MRACVIVLALLACGSAAANVEVLIRPRVAAKPADWERLQKELAPEKRRELGSTGVQLWSVRKSPAEAERTLSEYRRAFAHQVVQGDYRDIVSPAAESSLPEGARKNLEKVKGRKYGPTTTVRMLKPEFAGVFLRRGLPRDERFPLAASVGWNLGYGKPFYSTRVAWRTHDRSTEFFSWAGDLDIPKDRKRWTRYEGGLAAATYSHGNVYARFERGGRIFQMVPLGEGYHAVVEVDARKIPELQADTPRMEDPPGEQPDAYQPMACADGQADTPLMEDPPGEQPDAMVRERLQADTPRMEDPPGEQPDSPAMSDPPGEQPDGLGYCLGACAPVYTARGQGCYEGPKTCAVVRIGIGYTKMAEQALPATVAPGTKRFGYVVPRDIDHYAQYLVDLTSLSFVASGIHARVRLSGVATFDGIERTDRNTEKILGDLRKPPAGTEFARAAGWRNQSSADILVMLTMSDNFPDATGAPRKISGLSPAWGDVLKPKNGYSIVVLPYADANLSFLHELGHHFGARHEPNPNDPQDQWYGRGFRDHCRYRTIMAYDAEEKECAKSVPRYLMWSSCNLWRDGAAAGSALQNNVRVINEQAGRVSGFRP